jgi:hypothetical protein
MQLPAVPWKRRISSFQLRASPPSPTSDRPCPQGMHPTCNHSPYHSRHPSMLKAPWDQIVIHFCSSFPSSGSADRSLPPGLLAFYGPVQLQSAPLRPLVQCGQHRGRFEFWAMGSWTCLAGWTLVIGRHRWRGQTMLGLANAAQTGLLPRLSKKPGPVFLEQDLPRHGLHGQRTWLNLYAPV